MDSCPPQARQSELADDSILPCTWHQILIFGGGGGGGGGGCNNIVGDLYIALDV